MVKRKIEDFPSLWEYILNHVLSRVYGTDSMRTQLAKAQSLLTQYEKNGQKLEVDV